MNFLRNTDDSYIWKIEDENKLMELYYELGNKWSEIAKYFPNTYLYKSHVAMASSSKTNFTQDFAGPSVILMLSYNRTFLKPKISFLLISFLR